MSELAVGTIVSAEEHPGARAPSLVVEVDLGVHGRHPATVPLGDYSPDELEGAQVLVRRDVDEITVLGAQSHGRGFVLLRPDRDVEDGAVVG